MDIGPGCGALELNLPGFVLVGPYLQTGEASLGKFLPGAAHGFLFTLRRPIVQFKSFQGEMESTMGLALTQDERKYLTASLEQQAREEEADLERQAREERLELRSRNRLRYLVGVFGIAAIVAG